MMQIVHAYLQGFFCCAAWLLLQLARVQSFNVFVTLLVAIIQQVLLSLQQTLAWCNIPDSNRETPVC